MNRAGRPVAVIGCSWSVGTALRRGIERDAKGASLSVGIPECRSAQPADSRALLGDSAGRPLPAAFRRHVHETVQVVHGRLRRADGAGVGPRLGVRGNADFGRPGNEPTLRSSPESPQLSSAQLDRLISYGVAQQVRVRDIVFRPGDAAYDLIVVESGRIQIIAPATRDEPEEILAEYGPGGFLGELNLLTGQAVYLTARVVEAGTIHRLARDQFRRLMAEDAEVSDLLLRTFLARIYIVR